MSPERRTEWRRPARRGRVPAATGWLLVLVLAGCSRSVSDASGKRDRDDPFAAARHEMVEQGIEPRIQSPRVLDALRTVPREQFVPKTLESRAYENVPLQIGRGQTISQPVIVGIMTDLLDLDGSERVLEIGTGSGYQTAILAELAARVYTIEIIEELSLRAQKVLRKLGYDNVRFRVGDGFEGWPEEAPFDAIIVTAAPEEIPPPLVEQLAVGGRLVIPVGDQWQELMLVRRNSERPGDVSTETIEPVRFVPMTGKAQEMHSEEDGE